MGRYDLTWIDKNAEHGPIFSIGRDTYERPRAGQRLIWLKAVESYPGPIAEVAAEAFTQCAKAWGAPIVFVIDPNLAKPPAGRFLFEWSRTTFENKSVERSFMCTSNAVSRWMGKIVLRLFSDGSMPFEAIQGRDKLNAHLDTLDLSCPRDGFEVLDPGSAMVLHQGSRPGLMRSLLGRMARRLGGGKR